jgi:hypothetical protein
MAKTFPEPAAGFLRLERFYLGAACFCSGAALMVIELSAARLLAPMFGNSIYTWTALIGVILVAFSAGGYAGGRLADRRAGPEVLGWLLAAAALLTFLIPGLAVLLGPMLSDRGLVQGPVLFALLLLALPGALLGAVSPASVRLYSLTWKDSHVGGAAGTVSMLGSLGSFVGAIGGGFFQMSLSQVYVVYTFAGLLATLYRRERWGVGLFAVGGMLLLFAGIYWYVLPTFLTGSMLVLCAVVGRWVTWRQPGSSIDWRMIGRFLLAALFLAGLGAIRLIPEIANYSVQIHPGEPFARFNPFMETLQRYFVPIFSNDLMRYPQAFHYAFPATVFFGLLALRVLTLLHPAVPRWRWRIWIPAIIAIWVFAIWAQVNNPIIHALYDAIPPLHSWRLIERMQAGGSIWVAVLGAVMLDDLWRVARWYIRRVKYRGRVGAYGSQIAKGVFACLSLGVVLYVGADISGNWDRVSGVEPKGDLEGQSLAVIRAENPNGIVSVYTSDFFSYFSFPTYLVRAWTGNPDYRPRIDPTVGDIMPHLLARFEPEFAVAAGFEYWNTSLLQEYVDYPPTLGYARYKPDAVPYAFAMPLAVIQAHTSAYTLPTSAMSYELAYEHHVDSVTVYANGVSEETLIGAQETAYPGWQVTVNGQPRKLESLYGYLGVRVYPEDGQRLQIDFSYQPRALYAGSIIMLVTAGLTAIYLLRRERWLYPVLRLMGIDPQKVRLPKPMRVRAAKVAAKTSPIQPTPPPAAEMSATPSIKRMEIGLRKAEIRLPPSADPQTVEVIPNGVVRAIVIALTAAAAAFAALCLFLLRMPSRKE